MSTVLIDVYNVSFLCFERCFAEKQGWPWQPEHIDTFYSICASRTFDPSLAEAWRKKAFGQKDFLFPSESQRRYPLFDSSYVFVACSMNFFHIQNATMYYPLVASTPNAATKCYKGLPVCITKNYNVWTCCSPRPASLRSRVRRKLACVTPRLSELLTSSSQAADLEAVHSSALVTTALCAACMKRFLHVTSLVRFRCRDDGSWCQKKGHV